MKTPRLLPALSLALLLAGCADFGGLAPASRPADPAALKADTLAGTEAREGAIRSWPVEGWWKDLGDAQLDELMDEALANSPTLAVARARLEQADAQARAADANRLFRLDATGQVDRQRYTENGLYPPPYGGATYDSGQLALDFSYQFDFWGRQGSALNAALSRARAAAFEAQAARLTLSAALAQSYIELDRQYALLEVAQDAIRQREKIRELTALRQKAGLETEVELRQSAASVHGARADAEAAQERIVLLKNALGALAGRGPDRGGALARPQLKESPALALPSVLPAELLGRRPDVAAQRQRVEAAAADIDAARAGFYPNVSLTLFSGFQSIGLDELLKTGSRMSGIGLALNLPIFDGGRLRANLAGRNADYDLAVEQYNGALVEGLHEVADALASGQAVDRQSAEQARAEEEAEAAYRIARQRYLGELSSYLSVLSVETQVLTQRRLAADLRARRLGAAVSLVRALGGGFIPDAPQQ